MVANSKAFVELLQTKELHKIRISDICKRCQLNRSTFYANHADIYELADKIREDLEREVNLLYKAETTQRFNSHDYLKLFATLRKINGFTAPTLSWVMTIHSSSNIMTFIRQSVTLTIATLTIIIEFFRSGLNAMIKNSLSVGAHETPEEMDDIIRSEYQGRFALPQTGLAPVRSNQADCKI